MNPTFSLILIVVGAYLAAHVAFEWLARRFHIVSGAEYLLLGVLLGPHVSGLLSASVLGGFAPFLTLSLGWIGVVVGAQFYLPELVRIRAAHYRIAFGEAGLTYSLASVAMAGVFHLWFDLSWEQAAIPAAVSGAVAVATAPTGIALVARRLGRSGPVVRQLQLTAAVDALTAVAAFGLVLSVVHPPIPTSVRPLTPTEWVAVSLGIGVIGGILFHLFLGEERGIDRLFIGLAGAVILTSGAAAHLRLSPLLPTMLVGMILINTSASRIEIKQVLTMVERPVYFVLLIFAGAAWDPGGWSWLLPVVVFLLARTLAKLSAGALSAWYNGALQALGPGWGRALLGQGGLAIAIALNYQIQERSILANVVFTAALISVLLTDLTSARTVEGVVRAAHDRLSRAAAAIFEPREV